MQVSVMLRVLTPDGAAICGVERTEVIVTTQDGETNVDRAQAKMDELIVDAHEVVKGQMREFRAQFAEDLPARGRRRPGR